MSILKNYDLIAEPYIHRDIPLVIGDCEPDDIGGAAKKVLAIVTYKRNPYDKSCGGYDDLWDLMILNYYPGRVPSFGFTNYCHPYAAGAKVATWCEIKGIDENGNESDIAWLDPHESVGDDGEDYLALVEVINPLDDSCLQYPNYEIVTFCNGRWYTSYDFKFLFFMDEAAHVKGIMLDAFICKAVKGVVPLDEFACNLFKSQGL